MFARNLWTRLGSILVIAACVLVFGAMMSGTVSALPRTAGHMPLVALIGLLSLAASLGLAIAFRKLCAHRFSSR